MKFTALAMTLMLAAPVFGELRAVQAKTKKGTVEGVVSADGKVRTFKGIPFAAPPVGALRWTAPREAAAWKGVRKAVEYGPRCMQGNIFSDMVFHDAGPSEDCLYLNLWMPEGVKGPLPVMVWIYGGGFMAGATSEARQDGGNLSKKGVIVVSMNYRLGAFGFFSHPELDKESDRNASGNYGLLDQVAALQWVHDNIAAFGGDPGNVTIFGESAGSFSVSAMMASPLSRGLFQRAIGESGSFTGSRQLARPRVESEAADGKFAESAFGTTSLEKLRAIPGEQMLEAATKQRGTRFWPNVDGYLFTEEPTLTYAAGRQAQVPLLAGWNADEGSYRTFFEKDAVNAENYAARARKRFGAHAEEFLKLYPGESDAQAKQSANDLAGDDFIAFSTWKWLDLQRAGKSPVYRYRFEQTLPLTPEAAAKPDAEPRAYHSAEIEFVFRVLSSKALPWREDDRALSETMASYWTNFARTGDPNGPGLPKWPVYTSDAGFPLMHLGPQLGATTDSMRGRYEFLDRLRMEK